MKPIAVRWREESTHYESLVVCLRSLLAGVGRDCAYRDLLTALGLGPLLCAHEREPLGWWWTVARDARLGPVAEALGLRLRELHPPEAAIEYEPTPEYTQHFRDSYMPLIEQALAHGQVVLLWGGWPAPRERLWGLVTTRRSGMLVGLTLWHNGQPMPLISAARQVYIVEGVEPEGGAWSLGPEAFGRVAAWCLGQWDNHWLDGARVQTGQVAWRRWAQRVGGMGHGDEVPLYRQHAQLARVTASARRQLAEWLRAIGPRLADGQVELAAHWAAQCDRVAGLLGAWAADEAARQQFERPDGPQAVAASLEAACQIEAEVIQALRSVADPQPLAGTREPAPAEEHGGR